MDRNWEEDMDRINKYTARDGQEDTIQGIAHFYLTECQRQANQLEEIEAKTAMILRVARHKDRTVCTPCREKRDGNCNSCIIGAFMKQSKALEKALKAHQVARFEAFLKENAREMEGTADEN